MFNLCSELLVLTAAGVLFAPCTWRRLFHFVLLCTYKVFIPEERMKRTSSIYTLSVFSRCGALKTYLRHKQALIHNSYLNILFCATAKRECAYLCRLTQKALCWVGRASRSPQAAHNCATRRMPHSAGVMGRAWASHIPEGAERLGQRSLMESSASGKQPGRNHKPTGAEPGSYSTNKNRTKISVIDSK